MLSVPDGPRVATLLSATPVGGDSGVETVVATLQDLAPLEELDRMRADFLGMVSHELRVPLTSIKGASTTVLGARRAEPSDAGALIDAARGAFLAGGTGHDVAIGLPADLPRVMADRARVVQVLGNLLESGALGR